jgi:hypothetical protein
MGCKVFCFILLLCLALSPFQNSISAFASTTYQSSERYFPPTGYTVRGRFLEYWDDHGGLFQQGYPISDEAEQQSSIDGKVYDTQYFERAVFEYHPENQRPNDVLLSLLGVILYQRQHPNGAPNQVPNTSPSSVQFPETGKRLGGKFLGYWQTHGGLAQQGYPISDEFQERSVTDNKTYTVQYFERARFEWHPEQAGTNNEVLLGLLGNEQLASLGLNLEDNTFGWHVPWCEIESQGAPCTGPGAPGYDPPSAVSSPSMDGKALRLALKGLPKSAGNPGHYANVMFRYDIPAAARATRANAFAMDLWFLYRPATTFNDLNWKSEPARIQAIEFAVTKWLGERRWDCEIQWTNVRGQSDLPSVWSVVGVNSSGQYEWEPTGVAAQPEANRWHHLVLRVSIIGGQSHYDSFAIDGAEHVLNQTFPSFAQGGELVTTHVQLDGSPEIKDGYEVFVDNVNLSWYDK